MGYYNSFVVRIWSSEHGWTRGKIEHVATHDSLVFDDLAELDDFVRRHLNPPSSHTPDPLEDWLDQESPSDGSPSD